MGVHLQSDQLVDNEEVPGLVAELDSQFVGCRLVEVCALAPVAGCWPPV